MSWSFSVPVGLAENFTPAIEYAWAKARELNPQVFVEPEVIVQVEEAVSYAKTAIGRGAVGRGLVSASLSGHANTDHKPRRGWSNDMTSVNLYCAEPTLPANL